MKMILIIIGAVAALFVIAVGAILIIGFSLPVAHVASRSISLNRPASEVYAKIRNFEKAAEWRSEIKNVEVLLPVDGRLQFREDGPHGSVLYELMEDMPEKKLVTRIATQGLGYSGTWTYKLDSVGQTTKLTITENGEVQNPVFRFASRYVFGHSATIDNYLQSLEKSFNKP